MLTTNESPFETEQVLIPSRCILESFGGEIQQGRHVLAHVLWILEDSGPDLAVSRVCCDAFVLEGNSVFLREENAQSLVGVRRAAERERDQTKPTSVPCCFSNFHHQAHASP